MGLFDWLFKKSEAAPTPPKAEGKAWKVGDRVLAKWFDGFFYPGKINAVSSDNCQVFFDDGDVAWVHRAHVQVPDIVEGSKVFARIKAGPAYYPGTVSETKGETIHVRYDHGDEEWTSISLVRVNRPITPIGAAEPPPGFQPPGPVKQEVDLGEPVDGGDWRVGDRVLGRWLDFFWYPGTILRMGRKGYHILFDDGDQRVVQENGIMPLAVEEGEQVYIRPRGEQVALRPKVDLQGYLPAVVMRVNGESIDVEYEDGRHEANTRVSRARFWRCPAGVHAFAFEEGDRVLACDVDECTYPAEIISVQDDRVIIQFLDGPERMLTPELIKKFDLRLGSRIECRWRGGPNYFPGVLAKLDGERVYVEYDDGDKEWTSVRLVRIPKPKA